MLLVLGVLLLAPALDAADEVSWPDGDPVGVLLVIDDALETHGARAIVLAQAHDAGLVVVFDREATALAQMRRTVAGVDVRRRFGAALARRLSADVADVERRAGRVVARKQLIVGAPLADVLLDVGAGDRGAISVFDRIGVFGVPASRFDVCATLRGTSRCFAELEEPSYAAEDGHDDVPGADRIKRFLAWFWGRPEPALLARRVTP